MTNMQQYYATAAEIVKFWTSHGFTLAQACGVLAQADAESSLNPKAVGDHDQAHGLFQLHPDRMAAIKKGCGIDVTTASVVDQCAAVLWELNHSERRAMVALRTSETAAEAGSDMCRFYERPADQAQWAKRGAKAAAWLEYFQKNPIK